MPRSGIRAQFKSQPVGIQAAIIGGVFAIAAALVPAFLQMKGCDHRNPKATVAITRLLPDPVGDDQTDEEATLRNFGGQAVSLAAWKLRDLVGRSWSLDQLGVLEAAGQPGDQKTIRRNGQPMGLNNAGDTVELVDAKGSVVDKVVYSQVREGEEVVPPR